ncbi:MAG: biosis protein MshO [Pseudomonadota bacterium]|nr:biosis protein MshO [Pseudomonadota bacterium]
MNTVRPFTAVNRGFTLVEMVVVIAITAIIAGMIGSFIRWPVNAYFDTERRARLTEAADTALRRISRDLRTALPNSVRVVAAGATTYLEFIPTVGGGRYRNYPTAAGTGNPLDFNVADASFDVVGPVPVYAAGNSVVIYNMGPGTFSDAYAGTNRAAVTSANATMPAAPLAFSTDAAPHTITLAAATLFPSTSPSSLFQIVGTPVTYACTPGGGLLRYAGYAFAAAQPTPPAVVPAALVNGVTACTIDYDPVVARVRTALVTLTIDLAEQGETIRMVHQMHVLNTP